MKFWLAIKRFISVAWLVAAPIVIIVLWFGPYMFLGLVSLLAGLAFGPEAAREVDEYVYGLGLLEGAFLGLAFLFLPFYAFFRM
jgi:hypothetical protein